MPWDDGSGSGIWFPGLTQPPSAIDESEVEQHFDNTYVLCDWYSYLDSGLSGLEECSTQNSNFLNVTGDLVLPPGSNDYFTIYVAGPTEFPEGGGPWPSVCEPNFYRDTTSKTYRKCPRTSVDPSMSVVAEAGGSSSFYTPTGAASATGGNYSAAAPGVLGFPTVGWVANPDPITDDPYIDTADPATVLLWRPDQFPTTFSWTTDDPGPHTDIGHWRSSTFVYGWKKVGAPPPLFENVAMVL